MTRRRDPASRPGNSIALRDGRTLGYADYGDPAGTVLFSFHGHPGSRVEAKLLAERAAEVGVRVIGVDRPGMGCRPSSLVAGCSTWPDDVAELADGLRIDSFAVVGFSGGGPYALACAHKLAGRLAACGTIAGVGRTGRFMSFLSLWLPWLLTPVASRMFRDDDHARDALQRFAQVGRARQEHSAPSGCPRDHDGVD